jgi:tetratricopeptide (TPR) repeat protein
MARDAGEIREALKRGDTLYDEGDFPQASEAYRDALVSGYESENFDLAVDACLRLGPLFSRQNNYADMLKAYENAILLVKTHKLKSREPLVYKRMGDGYWRVGALEMAKQYYKRCEETLDYIEDEYEKKLFSVSLYIDGYGNLLDEEGEFNEAIKYYKKSLGLLESLSEESDDEKIKLYNLYAKYNIGVAYERHGLFQEKLNNSADKWFQEGIKHFEEVRTLCKSTSYEFAVSTLDAAFCYSKLGETDIAEKYTKNAVELLSTPKIDAKDLLAWAFMNKGIIARQQKDFSEAVRNFKKAIEIYENIGIHEWVAMVYHELGVTYKMMGKEEKSDEAYKKSKMLVKGEMTLGESSENEEVGQSE